LNTIALQVKPSVATPAAKTPLGLVATFEDERPFRTRSYAQPRTFLVARADVVRFQDRISIVVNREQTFVH